MFSKWFQAQTAFAPSSPLASERAALAAAASSSSTRRPSAASWTRSVTGSACSGMVQHSLQKANLAVAAVIRLGAVESAVLEVAVRRVGAAAEAEVREGRA